MVQLGDRLKGSDALLLTADQALYLAKANGRDRVEMGRLEQ